MWRLSSDGGVLPTQIHYTLQIQKTESLLEAPNDTCMEIEDKNTYFYIHPFLQEKKTCGP